MIDTDDIKSKRLAMVIVDIQNKYAIGPLKENSAAIIPTVNSVIRAFREHDRPIIFIKMDRPEQSLQDIDDPEEFIDSLDYTEGDVVIHKREMGAFDRTTLAEILRGLGVDAIVICGLVSRFCVHATYFGAYNHDICPYLLKGGSASFNMEHTRMVESLCKTVDLDTILTNIDFCHQI